MTTSVRKARTSQPQDHPAKAITPRTKRPPQTVFLARGLRLEKTATGFQVVFIRPLYPVRTLVVLACMAFVLGVLVARVVLG